MSSILLLERAVLADSRIATQMNVSDQSLIDLLPNLTDRIEGALFIKNINNNVIDPILTAKLNKIEETFKDSIDLFAINASALEELVLRSNREKLNTQMEADRMFYQECRKTVNESDDWIDTKSIEEINEIVSIFQGYQKIVIRMLSQNMQLNPKTVAQISSEEWTRALYGTLLSIFCMFRMVRTRKYRDARKLPILIQLGKKYAVGLHSYSDTLDILSSHEIRD